VRRALLLAALAAMALWGCQPSPAVDSSAQGKPTDTVVAQTAPDTTQNDPALTEPVSTGSKPPEQPAQDPAKEAEPRSALPKTDKSLIPLAKDVDSAVAQAKKEGKFVLMKFEAEWCGPCQLMKKEAFNDPSVAELLKDAVVVPIDIDDAKTNALQKKYQVGSIPFLVFTQPDGKAFGAILGYESTDWLKRRIKEHLANRPGS
jgi:thiol:disulfide interchange protein